MKIIKTIWSFIRKIHKIIFSYDLADNFQDNNLYDNDNKYKIIIIRNEKDNELLMNQLKNEDRRNNLIIHYTKGDKRIEKEEFKKE